MSSPSLVCRVDSDGYGSPQNRVTSVTRFSAVYSKLNRRRALEC